MVGTPEGETEEKSGKHRELKGTRGKHGGGKHDEESRNEGEEDQDKRGGVRDEEEGRNKSDKDKGEHEEGRNELREEGKRTYTYIL